MKIQGKLASVTPVEAVTNLNEVRLEGDARKFTMFNKTDKASGHILWRAIDMRIGDAYEFDYEEKANAKNPKFPYHNLSHPQNITGSDVPATTPPTSLSDFHPIGSCPHCGGMISMEFYKA